jgi:hypothetical protein
MANEILVVERNREPGKVLLLAHFDFADSFCYHLRGKGYKFEKEQIVYREPVVDAYKNFKIGELLWSKIIIQTDDNFDKLVSGWNPRP